MEEQLPQNEMSQQSISSHEQLPPGDHFYNKKILIIAGIVIVVAAIGGYFWLTPKSIPSQEQVTPQELIRDGDFEIYVPKDGKHVRVYMVSDRLTQNVTLFEYDESTVKDNSGNFWSDLDASVALSPSKKVIAYIDDVGLKIYDLSTKNSVLITEHPQIFGESGCCGPYQIYIPRWSADNLHILVMQSLFEGASYAIVNIETREQKTILRGGATSVEWHPSEPILLLASSADGYNAPPGLYIVDLRNTSLMQSNLVNIAESFGKGNANFVKAEFSEDGSLILFTFNNKWGEDNKTASADIEGKNFRIIGPVDISDWKTYRNEEFGFEFQYPPTWTVKESTYTDKQSFWWGSVVVVSPAGTELEVYQQGLPGFGLEGLDSFVSTATISGIETRRTYWGYSYKRDEPLFVIFDSLQNKKYVEFEFLIDKYASKEELANAEKILSTFKFIESQ